MKKQKGFLTQLKKQFIFFVQCAGYCYQLYLILISQTSPDDSSIPTNIDITLRRYPHQLMLLAFNQ